MSSNSKTRPPAGGGPGPAPRPGVAPRSLRKLSLLLLVLVDLIVAVMMVVAFAGFVARPDPTVEAGPMYVVLALTTCAAVLMFFMALNASFLPLVTPQRARDVRLVMWTMAATGIVTGVLTLGEDVQSIVMRLVVGIIAFAFLRVQEARLDRARRSGFPGAVVPAEQRTAPRPKAKQRRGGRKH
jgi:hypothetical protein